MLIIKLDQGESIDKALKRYKRKVQNTKILRHVRKRKNFVKPSVERRAEILKASYIEKKNKN